MNKNQESKKHIPTRMCIVSRVKKPKKELVRIVFDGEKILVDQKGKLKGRGANIDQNLSFFDIAIEKGILARALKINRKLSEDEIKTLRIEFEEAVDQKKFRQGNKPVKIRVTKEELKKIS